MIPILGMSWLGRTAFWCLTVVSLLPWPLTFNKCCHCHMCAQAVWGRVELSLWFFCQNFQSIGSCPSQVLSLSQAALAGSSRRSRRRRSRRRSVGVVLYLAPPSPAAWAAPVCSRRPVRDLESVQVAILLEWKLFKINQKSESCWSENPIWIEVKVIKNTTERFTAFLFSGLLMTATCEM